MRHETLQPGDPCPKCKKGTVYETVRPGVLVRLVGQAPISATVYELQKLRCNLCGVVFTAQSPAGIGSEKYDATSGSMIALLKYGSGMPFNRMAGLQSNLGIPCLAHGRRQFVDVAESFPDECRYVLESLAVVYRNDATAREQKMSSSARRHFHQINSGPVMSLIHICELCVANPFDYLTELERHADELTANPRDWMPWNYRATLAGPAASSVAG